MSQQQNEEEEGRNGGGFAAAGGAGGGGGGGGGAAGGGRGNRRGSALRARHDISSFFIRHPRHFEDDELDADQDAFDEPDDELEEFDIIGGEQNAVDLEVAQWDEDWDVGGWDDEDVNDDFIKRLQQELEAFKEAQLAKQQQQQVKSG